MVRAYMLMPPGVRPRSRMVTTNDCNPAFDGRSPPSVGKRGKSLSVCADRAGRPVAKVNAVSDEVVSEQQFGRWTRRKGRRGRHVCGSGAREPMRWRFV